MELDTSSTSLLTWGVATRALQGQSESGDRHLVYPYAHGVLVAVVDGLGHGEDAAAAAERAVETLREHAHEPVVSLLQRCHTALEGTRGCVVSLASFHTAERTMTWAGVGDVEGVLIRVVASTSRAREFILQRGGVIGFRLPPLRADTLPVMPGDTLILATDGVSGEFTEEPVSRDPQQTASCLLEQFAKTTDDALVLVARYLGEVS